MEIKNILTTTTTTKHKAMESRQIEGRPNQDRKLPENSQKPRCAGTVATNLMKISSN